MRPSFVVVALLCASAPALAGSVEGTVREKGTRRPIPGAYVAVSGSDLSTYTDEQGAFVLAFEEARVGSVTLEVETSGFAKATQIVQLRRDRDTTSVDVFLEPTEIGETRVRERRSKDNIARGAHRIEENEVNELPGTYGDPAKAIENFPGMGRVFLSQGSLFVRGAAPGESAVFVDDYEIPDLYHFTGSTSVINIPFVESVELVPAAFSARYGRSTGGVVALRTKKLPTDDVHGFAKLDVIDGGAYVGVPLTDKLAVGASARRSFLDVVRNAQKATVGTGDDVLLTPTYWDYQLKLDWDTAPGHELVLFAFGSGDREEYLSDGRGRLDPYLRQNDSDFHRVSLRYAHGIGSGFTHTFTPVVGYGRGTLVEQGGLRSADRQTYDAQLRDEITWRSGSSRVIVGVDSTARHDAYTYGGLLSNTGIVEIPSADLESAIAVDQTVERTWRVTGAAYVEGSMEPLDAVVLTPGLRVEGYLLDLVPHVSFEPRFAGSWHVVDGPWGTMLKVAAGMHSRPPDPDELAAARRASVDLVPQQALHIQGGFDQGLGDVVTLSTTLFQIWRDELTTRSSGFPVPARPADPAVTQTGSGRSTGFEVLARAGAPQKYFAWLTYSLARHERLDGPSKLGASYLYPSAFDTTHLVGAVGQLYLWWGFRVGARARVASGMPEQQVAGSILDADTGRYVAVPGPKGGARYPPFWSLDLRVDWSTRFDWFELDLYADLVNANTVIFGRPIESTLYNYDFSETTPRYGLPIVPAIGAKATF